jgi:hypothetical protein
VEERESGIMGLTEDLRECAKVLEIDFIGFSPADSFDGVPEDRKPKLYLEDALSIVSIGYKLNYTSIQNLPESRSAYMLEHDYANRHLGQSSHKVTRFLEKRGFKAMGLMAALGSMPRSGNPQRPLRETSPISTLQSPLAWESLA